MPLRGKFLRREGTLAFFGTRSKPEWKPIEISGQIDPTQLEHGQFYELNLDENRLVGYHKLADRAPATYQPPQGGAGQSSSHGAPAAKVPLQSLCASATGVVKSCLEKGMPVEDSMSAGLKWAALWGELPEQAKPKQAPPPSHSGEFDSSPDPDW